METTPSAHVNTRRERARVDVDPATGSSILRASRVFPVEDQCDACLFEVGGTISIIAQGLSGDHLAIGTAGTMLDVANGRYDFLNTLPAAFPNATRFVYRCTAEGPFTVDRTWFKDSRLSSPVGDAMVRGSGTTLTVEPGSLEELPAVTHTSRFQARVGFVLKGSP